MPEIHFQTAQGTHGILTMGLPLESPPIRKGCRARRVWLYFHRMDRIDRLAKATPQPTFAASMSFGAAALDTMEHLEVEGIGFMEPDDYTACFWHDLKGELNGMLKRIEAWGECEGCDRTP